MLQQLLSKELIQIHVEASDWEEAIRKSAQPLVDGKKIKQEYVENIIQTVKEMGPYFVLLPQVALPHARPEEGAIQNAIGLTVLNHPVIFGHAHHDPVKYIFTLSAKGDEAHVDALSELSLLLEDQLLLETLDQAKTIDEIYHYLFKNKDMKKN